MAVDAFEAAWRVTRGIPGWLENKHQAHVMWRRAQSGLNVIEIGSYCGKSAILMALGMKAARSSAMVYCVDTFEASSAELDGRGTLMEFAANVVDAGVNGWVAPVVGDSHSEATAALVPDEAGLLYVDGDHSYAAVMRDIELWGQKVAPGGMIMFHDCYEDGRWPDVRRAVFDAQDAGLIMGVTLLLPDAALAWPCVDMGHGAATTASTDQSGNRR